MQGNMTVDQLFNVLYGEKIEASWCRTCVKRSNCKIQGEVAFEERMLNFGERNHIKIKAECVDYINDSKVKGIKEELLRDLGVRGRRI